MWYAFVDKCVWTRRLTTHYQQQQHTTATTTTAKCEILMKNRTIKSVDRYELTHSTDKYQEIIIWLSINDKMIKDNSQWAMQLIYTLIERLLMLPHSGTLRKW